MHFSDLSSAYTPTSVYLCIYIPTLLTFRSREPEQESLDLRFLFVMVVIGVAAIATSIATIAASVCLT